MADTVDADHPELVFGPGAKNVAMRSIVPKSEQRAVLFFRFCQVVANVWLPMVLMWVVSPGIILPLWGVLYWLPALIVTGPEVFTQPRHVITPSSSSLFGIARVQRRATMEWLFSTVRPILMIVLSLGIATLVVRVGRAHGISD